jgi:hypothetical protein
MLVCVAAATMFAASAMGATLSISIGVRETEFSGGADNGIGGNGGATGGIEFINLDGLTLSLNNTWQQFSFDLANANLNDQVTPFAGATANGVLDGLYGTLEHIRIKSNGNSEPIPLWIDDVVNTFDPPGPPPTQSVLIGNGFEGFADGSEVMFQEPSFSGSTLANLLAGSTAGVDSSVFLNGTASYGIEFQFVDNNPTRWLRLTSFNTVNVPNPIVRFDQNSVVSFWMRGVPEPSTLVLLGLSGLWPYRGRQRKS